MTIQKTAVYVEVTVFSFHGHPVHYGDLLRLDHYTALLTSDL